MCHSFTPGQQSAAVVTAWLRLVLDPQGICTESRRFLDCMCVEQRDAACNRPPKMLTAEQAVTM